MGLLKIGAVVVGVLVVLVLGAVAWLYWRALAGGLRARAALAARIAPVTEALARGETPSDTLLMRYAENRETRKVLFEVLDEAQKTDLFPPAYMEWEHVGEADLVAWLCHPNELAAPPAEIELMARVPAPAPPAGEYLVFRYRTHEPHWAADKGWLAGVAGPYVLDGPRRFHGDGTFSRFEPFDSRSPEEHVALVHAAVFGEPEAGSAGTGQG